VDKRFSEGNIVLSVPGEGPGSTNYAFLYKIYFIIFNLRT